MLQSNSERCLLLLSCTATVTGALLNVEFLCLNFHHKAVMPEVRLKELTVKAKLWSAIGKTSCATLLNQNATPRGSSSRLEPGSAQAGPPGATSRWVPSIFNNRDSTISLWYLVILQRQSVFWCPRGPVSVSVCSHGLWSCPWAPLAGPGFVPLALSCWYLHRGEIPPSLLCLGTAVPAFPASAQSPDSPGPSYPWPLAGLCSMSLSFLCWGAGPSIPRVSPSPPAGPAPPNTAPTALAPRLCRDYTEHNPS